MSYQVLARKWRPRGFDQLVGQEHVVRALVNALEQDRLHHAYLFTGTRGVGKTTVARILAKALNCVEGISATPCGVCEVCRDIDAGRFIDLIEVDAASRTKVEQTRELLENVQFMPTSGRYKVYLIDEVHMFSESSFNALLKTLEEPPPHVKFLLATTDPQKLPATILSRCLQLSLKRMTPTVITGQLRTILDSEAIGYEPAALDRIARAADGSMRDALSLLDQAIAFGAGEVTDDAVRVMLGAIEQDHVAALLQALGDGDAAGLLAVVARVADQGQDCAPLLDELLQVLHRVAVVQAVPEADDPEAPGHTLVVDLAGRLPPADVQLYYQIALIGRRDLPLALDARRGLEMVLLRMLAFRPGDDGPATAATPAPGSRPAQPQAAGGSAPPATPRTAAAPPARSRPQREVAAAPAPRPDSENPAPQAAPEPAATTKPASLPLDPQGWAELVAELGLSGMARQLANHSALISGGEGRVELRLDVDHRALQTARTEQALAAALSTWLGGPVQLDIQIGAPPVATPAAQQQSAAQARQTEAERAIAEDPVVRALQDQFDARVDPGSIKPH